MAHKRHHAPTVSNRTWFPRAKQPPAEPRAGVFSVLGLDFRTFVYLHKLLRFDAKHHANEVRSRFACILAVNLPDVAATIDESDFGFMHLEVGALKQATRSAIRNREWETVIKHFEFVDELLRDAPAELQCAIQISYLGMLFHGETCLNYEKARILLPNPLKTELKNVEHHYSVLLLPANTSI